MRKTLGILAVLFVLSVAGRSVIYRTPVEKNVRLDPALPRVSFRPASSSIGMVAGAEWVDNQLYVLDPARSEVVVMEKGAWGWTETTSFGSEGRGPGEFQWPTDMVWLPEVGEFVILSTDRRAHHYSKDGAHIRDETIQLPCALGRGFLAPRPQGRYWVSGNCSYSDALGDTLFAVLAGEKDDGSWDVFARKPRFTLDGSFGTAFGLERPAYSGPSAAYLNAGNDLCFSVVDHSAEGGGSEGELCLQASRMEAPMPNDFQSGRLPPGPAFSWPSPLPSISGFGVHEDHLLLLRMYSADSVLVEKHAFNDPGKAGRRVAGGPMKGLVGCRNYGCLWFEAGVSENQLGLLLFSDLPQDSGR